jgi:eukaryotic-like serine/threonine-protein kinase
MAHAAAHIVCPLCRSENPEGAEACFKCGRALFVLVQGSVLAGRYEIRKPLGHGGMGRVYQAHDRTLDDRVAVKVLRPELTRDRELAARFRSEIKLARRVSHRNVCRIHEYGEDGRLRFISMEFIEGVNLREYLRGRAVGTEEAFEISLQMARGLEAVHELGIVHRDFKAANIMIDARGVVKLMDFGIAKQLGAGEGITTTGHVMGTPEYMSPEQARGGRVDLRSDVYALGCVVYEVFTGTGLFQGDSAAATLYKHLHEAPPLETPGLPGPLMAPLGRALAKLPAERFASVTEFLAALDAARRASGFQDPGTRPILLPLPVRPQLEPALPSAPDLAPLPGAARPGRRLSAPTRALVLPSPMDRWTAKAAAAIVIVAGVVMAYAFWPRAQPSETPGAAPLPTEQPSALPSPPPVPASPTMTLAAAPPAPTPRPGAPRGESTPAAPAPSPAAPTPVSSLVTGAAAGPTPSPRLTPESPTPPPLTGTLALIVVPPAEVFVDESGLGQVSSREVPLPPGRHLLEVRHPDYEPLRRVVRIRAGETERVVLDLAEKAIPKDR